MATLKGAVNQYFDFLRWRIKLTMHAVVWGVAGQSMDQNTESCHNFSKYFHRWHTTHMDQLSSNRELHESQTKVTLNFAMDHLEATCSCAHSIHILIGTQAQLYY